MDEETRYGSEIEDPYPKRDALDVRSATRWELFTDQRNPIALVRIKDGSKRRQRPAILTVD